MYRSSTWFDLSTCTEDKSTISLSQLQIYLACHSTATATPCLAPLAQDGLKRTIPLAPFSHGHRDPNRPGYIHTGSGILVVNNVTTGAKYKQTTDKLRSSDSRPAPLHLIRSAMDLYLFLRAFIFCRHYTSVR